MELDKIPDIAKYLSAVFLFAWIGRSTVWNFLPVFFENNVESVFLVGILTSIGSAIPILLDIPVGNLVQRAGEKIVILIGLLTAIFPPIFYYTAFTPLLFAGKLVEGAAKSLIWNGSWSLTLKSSSEENSSESISVFLLGINMAIVIGPVIGGFLIQGYGFGIPMALWVLSSSLAVLVYYFYIGAETEKGLKSSTEDLLHRNTYLNDFHHLKENWVNLRQELSLIFLYSIIFSFYWLAVPLLLDQMNADFTTMGLIFGFAALSKIFQFIFGDIADKIGKHRTVRLLTVLLIPTLFAMSLVESLVLTGALFFLARVFTSGMSPAIHGIFDEEVPNEIEGEMTGFNELAKHIGQTIGPFFAGTVASIWSLNGSFIAASGVAGLILLASLIDF
ncbi:MFS transporter [Candidatus Nanohalobium constans]|uniref:Major facilitator superfamily MFS_1 n=1 Tax=Candidatus Nanohalobium constans TaxID=2565781 RepID=A0A5Q0UGI3_9ARCH|nr:MFS transporter [Candidatus Nanohalobium constans]QGA80686.1 major facilitator superfamily MFS_1 [Candidatus Nanohalobium constans]